MSQKSRRGDRQVNLVSIKDLSICHLLRQKLFLTVSESVICPKDIPLYRLKHPTAAIYRTSLLKKLSSRIHNTLAIELSQERIISLPRQNLAYAIIATTDGYIDFRFTLQALTQWLHQLSSCLALHEIVQPKNSKPEPSHLFLCQYSHARSCALLRLASREGLISYTDGWSVLKPQVEPIIRALLFEFNAAGTLILQDPYEKSLALAMLSVVDSFESGQSSQWQLITLNFCQAFLVFERYCRIFGPLNREKPELAQSRLWLIALFQRLLQKLLQEKLGLTPLTQL